MKKTIRNLFAAIAILALIAPVSVAQETATKKQEKESTSEKQESDKSDEGDDESKGADEKEEEKPMEMAAFSVADGALNFKAPKVWKKQTPKINMIEAEYKIVRTEGDERDGRMTIMGAGGSIQANIDRWIGQFEQSDGSSTKEKTKVKKVEVNECPIHMVEITGNFMESSGGPFGPKTEREDYQMLAAIIETPDNGNYFIKLYGPKKTITKNKKGFHLMLKSFTIED